MQSSTLLKILAGILVTVVIGVAIYYFGFSSNSGNSTDPNNGGTDRGEAFQEMGNLVRNNPGLKPNVWHLVYEAPGQSALSVELVFDTASICTIDDKEEECDLSSFEQGARAEAVGTKLDNTVTVETLTVFPENDNEPSDDMVRVTSPQPNAHIQSPLTITGEARGTWYFEASFPIRLLDANGRELGTAVAQAQEDWMTENFVPFQTQLTFTAPTTATGTLVLEKDNPSGLPEHDDEVRIPVSFAQGEQTVKLYYYNAEQDKDATGNVLCSRKGLVAVERKIATSTTPIQDTIRLLLQGQLTTQEKAQGISSEYPLSGVALVGADLRNGHLTLEFKDPQNKTSGGSCRVSVLWYQIEETAKQFPGVTSVSFIPEELFQP